MYPWVLPTTHRLPAILPSCCPGTVSRPLLPGLPSTTANLFTVSCLCCADQRALFEQDQCVCVQVCVWCKVMPTRLGMLPDHAGPPQFTAARRPVPVKQEARADVGEPAAQIGGRSNTHRESTNTHQLQITWTSCRGLGFEILLRMTIHFF